MKTLKWVWLAVGWAVAAHAADGAALKEKPRLLVQDIAAQGVSSAEAAALTDAVVDALASRGLFDVVSSKDMQSLLGAERQKQLYGLCDSDSTACASSLGDALKARFVLSGQLSAVGGAYQLLLQCVDSQKGQAVARSARIAKNLETLQALVPYIAAEATGSPLPPPPSRVLPIALISAGSASLLAGGVLGMLALSRQAVLNEELCPAGAVEGQRCTGTSLKSRGFYLQQNGDISSQKSISIGLLAAGAALAVLGVYLMPPLEAGPRVSLRVVPSTQGVALVGGWP
ncbi:MAG: penicillin-binding protein activator LpoB [Myxococcaceae bacterium]|nr:penicillin-binding protein activator LpoB [Myxococcaceae bacterium]